MQILQGNGEIYPEGNETLFLLSDHEVLPLIDVRPFRKLMDRSRTEGENVFTLLVINRNGTFHQNGMNPLLCHIFTLLMKKAIDFIFLQESSSNLQMYSSNKIDDNKNQQVDLRCNSRFPVIAEINCNDDPLLLIDVSPFNKLMDRSRTQGETVFTLR